jgi:RNA polymerase sigma factor (sigma-70 family)
VDGDDAAQQAWTQALQAYPTLRSATNLRGWLLTITARCAIDVHRARARAPVPIGGPSRLPERPSTAARPGADPPDPALWNAVRHLPDRQRTAIALRYVADLDHPAIARLLGTTPAATRRLVCDALGTLRAQLAGPDGAGAAPGARAPDPDTATVVAGPPAVPAAPPPPAPATWKA